MDRRSSIKSLIIISAGAALLPSCFQEKEEPASLPLKNLKINNKQEALLSELSETIIPKTDTPGAKDVSAHLFALMMMDDCNTRDNQDKFSKGLKEFEEFSKKKFNKSFVASTPAEKVELLRSIENKKDVPENVSFFYSSMKKLTVQAFTTSQYYLTKVQVYKLVPGKFYGCIPVKKIS